MDELHCAFKAKYDETHRKTAPFIRQGALLAFQLIFSWMEPKSVKRNESLITMQDSLWEAFEPPGAQAIRLCAKPRGRFRSGEVASGF